MSDILEQGRAAIGGQPYFEGRKNAYECDGEGHSDFALKIGVQPKPGCGAFIVTIDVAPGVTPFMLKCGRCGGYAHSKMYRVQDWLEPTHEWYRPDTLDGIDPAYFDHLSRGGLILRPVEGRPDEWQLPPVKGEVSEARRAEMIHAMEEHLARAEAAAKEMRKEPMSRQQRRHQARKPANRP